MWNVLVQYLQEYQYLINILFLIFNTAVVGSAFFLTKRSYKLAADKSIIAESHYKSLERLLIGSKNKRHEIHELDLVTLFEKQTTHTGIHVPAGSTGTVVAVLKDGQAYMVEFIRPVAAVVTVRPGQIVPADNEAA